MSFLCQRLTDERLRLGWFHPVRRVKTELQTVNCLVDRLAPQERVSAHQFEGALAHDTPRGFSGWDSGQGLIGQHLVEAG